MRPATVRDKVVQDMADELCVGMKNLGKEVVAKYPNQSIKELADVLTRGFLQSPPYQEAEAIDKIHNTHGWPGVCEEAFRKAITKLLTQAKEQK